MIPKDSTPIKNKILIDILAKGLLNKDEMRIIFYIIRWSWGFDGEVRRQDWTKELNKRKIADDIGMDEGHLNRNINRMITENKIIIKDKCYQFNEHYEKWKNLTNGQVNNDKKLAKKSSKTCRLVKKSLTNSQVELAKKSSLGIPNNSGDSIKNKDLRGGERSFKETNTKENKETLKEKGINFTKAWKDFKIMRKKIRKEMTERAEELLLNKLNKLSNSEEEQIAILNQSIMNSWLGVFPLKGDYNGKSGRSIEQSKRPGEDKYKHLEETYEV